MRTNWQKRIGVGERQHVYGRVAGTDERIPVRREDNGRKAGEQINHWDGSVSAIAMPTTGTSPLSEAPKV